jgi:tetratricopeptide (TPR) repeat protein
MQASVKSGSKPEESGQGTRLDGWKQIAAYLSRVERTVKRWDAERGLPIHRVPGKGRASVFAFTAELDAWMVSRGAQTPEEANEEGPQTPAAEVELSAAPLVESVPAPTHAVDSVPQANGAGTIPRGVRQDWGWALTGTLLAGMLGIAIIAVALHSAAASVFPWAPRLFAKAQPAAVGTRSIPISDSEKAQAHELYLRGRYEWNQRTPNSLNRALDDFTQALIHDPGDAEAYVGMADTYNLLREYSNMPESEAYQRAILSARKAVALDNSLEEAHRALAFAEYWGDWNFADAEKEFHRAIELNPRDPLAHKWYANAIAVQGRFDEALSEIQKAQELDPSSHSLLADKGQLLFNAGRTQESLALLHDVERSAPELRSTHIYLANISFALRDWPTFLKESELAAEIAGDPALKDIAQTSKAGFNRQGERGLLAALYAKEQQYYTERKVLGVSLARTCLMLGHRQEALYLLEECYTRHEPSTLNCFPDPLFKSLKNEPGFQAIVNRINLPAAPTQPGPIVVPRPTLARLRMPLDSH